MDIAIRLAAVTPILIAIPFVSWAVSFTVLRTIR